MAVPDEWFATPCEPDELAPHERVGRSAVRAARDAALAIDMCNRFLHRASATDTLPGAGQALLRARRLWRETYYLWRMPCGNGLNIPDLLWLAQSHLFVCSQVRGLAGTTAVDTPAAHAVLNELVQTLRNWDSPARHGLAAANWPVLERRAMHTAVFWGRQRESFRPDFMDVDLSHHDVSSLSIGIDVHEALDNRTHTMEWKDQQSEQRAAEQARQAVERRAVHNRLDGKLDASALTLITVGSRCSFFLHLQLALVRPVPERYAVHTSGTRHDTQACRAHLVHLQQLYTDDSLLAQGMKLVQRALLAPGAVEHHLRLLRTLWHKQGGAAVLRSDVARRVPDLAVAHRITQATLAEVFQAEAPERWTLSEAFDANARREVHQLVRDVWLVLMLHNEIDSTYLVDWMGQYVVLQCDLRERDAVYVRPTRHGRPRLPVLLRVAASWCVHYPSEVWAFGTLEAAIVQWASLVQTRHEGRTETGVDLSPTLCELLGSTTVAAAPRVRDDG